MKHFLQLFFGLLVSVLFFSGCQREIGGDIPGTNPNDPSISSPIKASVNGLIVDENNRPFPGVTIKTASGSVGVTDSKGYFRFNNVVLDQNASLITAEIAGYFKGYRVFSASDKGLNFIKIQLLKKISSGNINSGSGGTVSISGYSITLPANSVVIKSTGNTYNGNITVFAHPIDPTATNISSILPGSLLGIDSMNKRVALKSYGMIAVELSGAGGEALQIGNGKTATLSFAIPASLQSEAPVSIPLWYVDEVSGLWKQEGVANRNGTNYTGTVKHFSFWNCDRNSDNLIFLELKIKNLAGSPIPSALVKISITTPSGSQIESYGYSDSAGNVRGYVPRNTVLTMRILNECYNVVFSQSIGPFSQNVSLGDFRVSFLMSEVNISGQVKNCNGQPIVNGWLNIFLENKYYNLAVNSSGQFNITLTHCNSNDITIIANDITTSQASNPYHLIIGTDSLNNLQLIACGNISVQYIVSTFAGDPFNPEGYIDGLGTAARFQLEPGIAADAFGNVYVADELNHCIRKITASGNVTTFAGNGTQGYVDGIGTAARFNRPKGVAVDASGNVFVADRFNHLIRKITPGGVVSTFAGDFAGGGGFSNGPALSATFSLPTNLVVDQNGNVFITELGNHCIRKINTLGVVSTLAGMGIQGFADGPGATAKFYNPVGIAVDPGGNIYVADRNNHRIRKITSSGVVTTFSGNGLSGFADGSISIATFNQPSGIAIDVAGNILIADEKNYRIRKIDVSNNVTTIAGNNSNVRLDGIGTNAGFGLPMAIAADNNGNYFVSDWHIIRKIRPQ